MEITIPAGKVRNGSLLNIHGIRYRLKITDIGNEHLIELKNEETKESRVVGRIIDGKPKYGPDLIHAKIIHIVELRWYSIGGGFYGNFKPILFANSISPISYP